MEVTSNQGGWSKVDKTWKWVQTKQDNPLFYLMCPHKSIKNTGLTIVFASKTFRREKFQLLVKLEVDRWKTIEGEEGGTFYLLTEYVIACRKCLNKYKSSVDSEGRWLEDIDVI